VTGEARAAVRSCPSASLPAQGSWQRGDPRAGEQAARRQGSPLQSPGAQGGPAMPVSAAQSPRLWLLGGEEEERAKNVMKAKAGGCCLQQTRMNAKGC